MIFLTVRNLHETQERVMIMNPVMMEDQGNIESGYLFIINLLSS